MKNVFVCVGGSDPKNFTSKIVEDLYQSNFNGNLHVVFGPGCKNFNGFKVAKPSKINLVVYNKPEKIWEIMSRCDLSFNAAATIQYELACIGIPSINIAIAKHQLDTAKYFEKYGCSHSLKSGFTKKELTNLFQYLNRNTNERKKMSLRGKKLVDGKGIFRITKLITELN